MAKVGCWRDIAESTIRRAMASLPADAGLKDRKAAVDAAYPFGERRWLPYKVWLKARRKALIPFGYVPLNQRKPISDQLAMHLSPLDRAKAKSTTIPGGAE